MNHGTSSAFLLVERLWWRFWIVWNMDSALPGQSSGNGSSSSETGDLMGPVSSSATGSDVVRESDEGTLSAFLLVEWLWWVSWVVRNMDSALLSPSSGEDSSSSETSDDMSVAPSSSLAVSDVSGKDGKCSSSAFLLVERLWWESWIVRNSDSAGL